MKVKDKLTIRERIMVGIIISLFLMVASIFCAVYDFIKIEEIISWKMLLLLSPFILFAIFMVILDILWDKEQKTKLND